LKVEGLPYELDQATAHRVEIEADSVMEEIGFIFQTLMPALLQGLLVTIALIVATIPGALVIGILMATGQIYGSRFVALLCNGYVAFFRGTPTLVVLFIFYFGFPSIGIRFSPFMAAFLGFTLGSGAYQSGYIKSALQSITTGQTLAARSIGMSKLQTITSIVLPQALRRAIPGCSNEIIYLVKYSSLAFMVTCVELTGAGQIVAAEYFKFTEVFAVVGAIYLVMVALATKLVNAVEKRLRIPGFDMASMV
jgi:polar amino acid transport system permease protein